MPLKKEVVTARYDFADYVNTADDAKAAIAAAFEDGDPAVITKMLGAFARSKGMGALAAETGLTRASLYKSLAEDGNPLFSTIAKVLDAAGLEMIVRPRHAPGRKREEMSTRRPDTGSKTPLFKSAVAKAAAKAGTKAATPKAPVEAAAAKQALAKAAPKIAAGKKASAKSSTLPARTPKQATARKPRKPNVAA